MKTNPVMRKRILLIEDDKGRIDIFKSWLADTDFLLVVTESAGKALGLLSRAGVETIAGVLLDHDLSDSAFTEMDEGMSASNVLPIMMRVLQKTSPILIHSHSLTRIFHRKTPMRHSLSRFSHWLRFSEKQPSTLIN